MYVYNRVSIFDVICVDAIHCIGGWVGCKTSSGTAPGSDIAVYGQLVGNSCRVRVCCIDHSVRDLRAVGLLARKRVSNGGSDRHRSVR
jgi:hypothetical protein